MLKNNLIYYLEKTIISFIVFKYKSFEILSEYEFLKKIFIFLWIKKKINIKLGIDPNTIYIHLGHKILFNKIYQFEKINFKIIIIIGSFTSYIGDPAWKSFKRNILKKSIIFLNIKNFIKQIKFYLRFKKWIKIYYNNEWIFHFNYHDFFILTYSLNIKNLLERKDFKIRNNKIYFYEINYQIFQSYDSIFINSIIEIGGLDQKLNFLLTRFLQKKNHKLKEILFLSYLLLGTDGYRKMSKSLKNFISIDEKIKNIYKKLLIISDKLIKLYLFYLSNKNINKILIYIKKNKNIFYIKKILSFEILKTLYNNKISEFYINKFEKEYFKFWPKILKSYILNFNFIFLYNFLKKYIFLKSKNKSINFIKSGVIKVNECNIINKNFFFIKGFFLIKKNKNFYIKLKLLNKISNKI